MPKASGHPARSAVWFELAVLRCPLRVSAILSIAKFICGECLIWVKITKTRNEHMFSALVPLPHMGRGDLAVTVEGKTVTPA